MLISFRIRTRSAVMVAIGVALMAGLAVNFRPLEAQKKETLWLSLGGPADSSRFFDGKQITKANVSKLEVAWNYPFGETGWAPLVAHGVIYGRGRNGALIALEAKTGKEIWIRENMGGMTSRGINYWESKDGSDRRLIYAFSDYLQELDAKTGTPIMRFGTNGVVDLRDGLGRDPATIGRVQTGTPGKVFENLIMLGSAPGEGYLSPPGDLRAWDVVTGQLVWTFHTVPHPGEFGYETWPKDAWKYVGGTNTWGEMALDEARGIAYFPTGSPTYDYYGADRPGQNLFADCLIALDARTGKRLWHFQAVHHDLWDYDPNAAPILTTVKRNGRTIDIVGLAPKTGSLFFFDRVTGEPIWPIEERPVPKSAMPGEQSWPTQPFVVGLPPHAKQTALSIQDVNPYDNITPEARQQLLDRLAKANNNGLFTPISFNDTIHMPGSNGGALFGTISSSPDGMVYVITQDNPGLLHLVDVAAPGAGRGGAPTQGQVIYNRECAVCHGQERVGSDAGPSLLDVATRLDVNAVRNAVVAGKGRMPAFVHLTPTDLDVLLPYVMAPPVQARGAGAGPLRGRGEGPATTFPPGPVVGSGPIQVRQGARGAGRGAAPPYPEGVPNTPRYVINEYGTITTRMRPPYTTIVKYDLNKSSIEWRVGFGDDPVLAAMGIHDTGTPQMRNGIVVTSAGLLFGGARDATVYAWDADTGKVLWKTQVGANMIGQPTMYEIDGRQYLLMAASGAVPGMARSGGAGPAGPGASAPAAASVPGATGGGRAAPVPAPSGPVGYIAYALPAVRR